MSLHLCSFSRLFWLLSVLWICIWILGSVCQFPQMNYIGFFFFDKWFFLRSFRFKAKLSIDRDFPYMSCPHPCVTFPVTVVPHQCTFVNDWWMHSDTASLLESVVYFRVPAWWCMFYRFGQMYEDMNSPYRIILDYFSF